MAKNITIKDIAREAGVSIALVSFVMNNRVGADGKQKYRVSPSTRDRILEVARRMHYQPSSAARMLRKGRTHVIGVIVSDVGNLFYGIIAKELEMILYQHGYTPLFFSTEEDPERFGRVIQLAAERDVEGFIMVPPAGSAQYVEQLQASETPFVVIDRYHPPHNVPSVLVDNKEAMRLAVQNLRQRGARNLALVSYSMRISSMTDREKSFREQLGEQAPIYYIGFNSVQEDAEKAVDQILAQHIDGVVTASNVPGVAIIKALMRRGIRIQQDIQITSFDFSNTYDLFDPPIPYIQQPLKQVASESAAYLFRLIAMKEQGQDFHEVKDHIVLKARLV